MNEYLSAKGNYGSGGVLFVQNTNTTVQAYSLNSSLSNAIADSATINAVQNSTTGANFAVKATNFSVTTTSAAISGVSGTGALTTGYVVNSGVRGQANGGSFSFGVLGEGTSRGVVGARVNAAGVAETSGAVGYSGSSGLHSFNDITAGGVKSFVEPHPTDPSKQIVFISLEGNEAGTYFRGRGRFAGGTASIDVPEEFRLVTEAEGLTVQITPIGRPAAVGVVQMDLRQIVVESTKDVEFSYLVQGFRHGYRNHQTLQENLYFVPNGPDQKLVEWTPQIRETLVKLGVYNNDGSVNMATAERMGWAQTWREGEAKTKAYQALAPKVDPQAGAPGGVPLLH